MNNKTTHNGVGINGLLGVLFIGLKLTHTINWSWWWVLAPFWIPAAITVLVVAVGLVVLLIKEFT